MSPELDIILIALVVSIGCALPGVFLILRRVSMMSDAISHSVLFGIITTYLIVRDVSSPWIIIGAAITGVLTVSLTELLIKTGKVKEDASIGLVFAFLFSVAVIMITRFAENVHIDADAVLLGELAFAPFDRFMFLGLDLPRSLVIMGIILVLNILFITIFYKELKLVTFDRTLALSLGFLPGLIHYVLMAMVSVTAVGAFDSVGSILVVALMIAIPSSAYLLSEKLSRMMILTVVISIISTISGYYFAKAFDGSIAGSMAMMAGFIFILALLFSPSQGLMQKALNQKRNKIVFSTNLLLVHLSDHEGTKAEATENTISHMSRHMRWQDAFSFKIINHALRNKWIEKREDRLKLTDSGKNKVDEVMGCC